MAPITVNCHSSRIPVITGLYAALAAIVLLGLSLRVVRLRRRHRVGIGDGGHNDLAQSIRAQANFTEYVPLALILLLVLEVSGGSAWLIHGLGIVLVAARVAHAAGLIRSRGTSVGRAAGASLTFLILLVAAILILLDWLGAGLP